MQIHYKGHWKRWALKIENFLSPERPRSDTHKHKITNVTVFYMAPGLNDFEGGGKFITRAIRRGGT
jgi:hypothetical protein